MQPLVRVTAERFEHVFEPRGIADRQHMSRRTGVERLEDVLEALGGHMH